METREIANILYNMSLDLDFHDYSDTANLDIEEIESELDTLQEHGTGFLFECLDRITTEHAHLLDVHKRYID